MNYIDKKLKEVDEFKIDLMAETDWLGQIKSFLKQALEEQREFYENCHQCEGLRNEALIEIKEYIEENREKVERLDRYVLDNLLQIINEKIK